MRFRLTGTGVGDGLRVALLLALFTVLGVAWYAGHGAGRGEDLAASYVGCRVLAAGEPDHLYSYSPVEFSEVGPDSAWKSAAARGGFEGFLHPYVQTPLWAFGLEPLCTRTTFNQFNWIFTVATMFSFAGVLWVVAWQWAPELMNAPCMALVVALLWFSEPFRYAMFLTQTHVIFFLMTVCALALAERGRPFWAGLLLACAAAVKMTPGFLLLYWVMTRRWKAAASMVAFSALLWGTTAMIAGRSLVAVYAADLDRIAHTLLLSQNNQSFAAWCMGRFYSFDEVSDLQIFTLPSAVRIGSLLLVVGWTLVGGWLDGRRNERGHTAPFGAMMALVAATLFSPIAWTHYFIILVAPLLVLAHQNLALRSKWIWCFIGLTILLNFQPIAWDVQQGDFYWFSAVRSEFYSGVTCLAGLAAAAFLESRKVRHSGEELTSRKTIVSTAVAA